MGFVFAVLTVQKARNPLRVILQTILISISWTSVSQYMQLLFKYSPPMRSIHRLLTAEKKRMLEGGYGFYSMKQNIQSFFRTQNFMTVPVLNLILFGFIAQFIEILRHLRHYITQILIVLHNLIFAVLNFKLLVFLEIKE